MVALMADRGYHVGKEPLNLSLSPKLVTAVLAVITAAFTGAAYIFYTRHEGQSVEAHVGVIEKEFQAHAAEEKAEQKEINVAIREMDRTLIQIGERMGVRRKKER